MFPRTRKNREKDRSREREIEKRKLKNLAYIKGVDRD